MSIINPYDTTMCTLINKTELYNAYTAYTNIFGRDLVYDFYGDGVYYYITGKNQQEKELPVADLPIYTKTIRNEPCCIMDIRPYTKPSNTENTLLGIARDKHNINCATIMSYFTLMFNDESKGTPMIRSILSNVMVAYGTILSRFISMSQTLPETDKYDLEVAGAILCYQLYTGSDISLDKDRLASILSNCKFRIKRPVRDCLNMVNVILTGYDVKMPILDKILLLVKNTVSIDYKEMITKEVIAASLRNSWFGYGGEKASFGLLESLPIFIALLYSTGASNNFNKSKFSTAILNNRNIQIADIVNHINKILKDDDAKVL